MKILVVGSGGREHALVWALKKDPRVKEIVAAPGNPGMARDARCVNVAVSDSDGLLRLATAEKVALTVVGPEVPLAAGLADRFRAQGLKIFGPNQAAARLESSKLFAKSFMQKYGLPTARHQAVRSRSEAEALRQSWGLPLVIKADGLAAGKGVSVCLTEEDWARALADFFDRKLFGASGATALVEEFLEGPEATIMAFCDGETLLPLPASQDHKRIGDGDTGPNTGGMGAYAPAPVVTPEIMEQVKTKIFAPFLKGLKAEGLSYQGVIYFGLMLTKEGPKLLEFNVRFGDPETQAVLPLVAKDFLSLVEATVEGKLSKTSWDPRKVQGAACCVVLASQGYPGPFGMGKKITGLEAAAQESSVAVFHAGTKENHSEDIVTDGGRVLGVTGLGKDLPEAIAKAYGTLEKIHFEGRTYRRDIGAKAIHAQL